MSRCNLLRVHDKIVLTFSSALQEKGLNVRQHLLEFHRRYYFAEAMKLVILDPVKSLDELQRGAERCFTSIPTRAMQQAAGIERPLPRRAGNSSAKLVKATQHVGNGAVTKTGQAGKRQTTSTQTAVGVIPARWRWIIGTAGWNRAFAEAQQLALITHAAGPDFFQFGCPFEQADRCMAYIFRIVPVKVVKKLQLSWTLPPLDCLWRCKPVDWVEHVLGHEGAGGRRCSLRLLMPNCVS